MQTIDLDDLVVTTFEACPTFATTGEGTPVCAVCGWLDTEHPSINEIAEVLTLARRARSPRRSNRLAS